MGSRFIMRLCVSDAVSSSGLSVSYMPPGDLKSGIPEETETPAPVSTTTDRGRAFLKRSATRSSDDDRAAT